MRIVYVYGCGRQNRHRHATSFVIMAIVIKAKNIYGDIDNNKIVNNEIKTVNFSENNITVVSNKSVGNTSFSGYTSEECTYSRAPLTAEQLTARNTGLTLKERVDGQIYTYRQNYYIAYFQANVPISSPIDLSQALSFDYNYTTGRGRKGGGGDTKTGTITGNVAQYYDNYAAFRKVGVGLKNGEQGYAPNFALGVLLDGTTSNNLSLAFGIVYDYQHTYPVSYTGFTYIEDRYLVQSVSASIAGQQFQVSSAPVSIGTGTFAQSLSYNELYQTETKITIGGTTEKIGTFLANKIINKWTNGKETAKLLVEYGEYYDTDGNLVKSVESNDKSMIFKIGEVVRPYVNSVSGDTPMSKNIDGTPKDFLIIGVEPFYDGACWQRLTLLEY